MILQMQELNCHLCNNQYSEDNPPRLLIMCGHTFCHNCIRVHIRHHNLKYQISCPLDKLTFSMESNNPFQFPRNMAILKLITHYHKHKSQQALKFYSKSVILTQQSDFQVSGQQLSYIQQLKGLSQNQQQYKQLVIKKQQNLCLLHQKPLDIICTHQRCMICAQCALFGMHKSHKFTTMKQLLSKQHIFIEGVDKLVRQQKQIDQKIKNGEFEQQICLIVTKKKQLLLYELSNTLKNMISQIMKFEQTQQQKIQQHISKMKEALKLQLRNNIQSNSKFNDWLSKIQKFTHPQNKDINHLIQINKCCNKSTNEIEKGQKLMEKIKSQLMNFWNQLQKKIEYPKLNVSGSFVKYLENNIEIKFNEEKKQLSFIDDGQLKVWSEINISDICDNSFLDVKGNDFKTDVKMGQNQKTYEGSTNLSQMFKYFKEEKAEEKAEEKRPLLRKIKSKQLTVHSTLLNFNTKINAYKSPKTRIKTQTSTIKIVSSPTIFKSSLKRFGLKVKECQKYMRMIDGLESNCLDVVDLTGFQLGDEITRQLCIKILQCNKVKMLKLMKNQLTDCCIKEVIDVLKVVDYLNLAQNAFTQKIIESLTVFSSKNILNKVKNVQLGQNQINNRRLKQKLQQLKKYRITITL